MKAESLFAYERSAIHMKRNRRGVLGTLRCLHFHKEDSFTSVPRRSRASFCTCTSGAECAASETFQDLLRLVATT